jgi:hypothetical protein
VLSAQPVRHVVVLGARAQSPGVSHVDHYKIPGLLPDLEDGLSDITELYLAQFKMLPPAGETPALLWTPYQKFSCR